MANFNYNMTMVGGRLTRDPELKVVKRDGEKYYITRFSVAVTRPDGETADFIGCVAFGEKAKFVSTYFQKGSSIFVQGHIKTDSYEDDEGNKRYITDIVADVIKFVDSKSDKPEDDSDDDDEDFKGSKKGASTSKGKNTAHGSKSSKTDSNKAKKPKFEEIDDDDDLPF